MSSITIAFYFFVSQYDVFMFPEYFTTLGDFLKILHVQTFVRLFDSIF